MVSFDHYIAALEQRVTNGGFIYRAGVAVAFDYKKGYKEYYLPPKKPGVVEVPEMAFLAVRGHGDPNEEGGAYKDALEMLYGVAYTIKMSKKGDHRIEGYFDFVVPPLEGFWWQDGVLGVDYARKEDFNWISAIRVPDFVTRSEFEWAVEEATAKKKRDFPRWSCSPLRRGCAFSACTWVPMMMSRRPSRRCARSPRRAVTLRIFLTSACIMRSTSTTPVVLRPRNSRQ